MPSISASEVALELLNRCLRGPEWPPDLLDALTDAALSPDPETAADAGRALFGILVERLADLFEPALCDAYAALFSRVIARAIPDLDAAGLVERYRRIRLPRRFDGDPARVEQVFVLSRVTLGADVAVTSVLLDAVKRRFPRARIRFAGTSRNWELFSGDGRLSWLPVRYSRTAALAERLAVWPKLCRALASPGALVVDPDSRLTQLGLLPVADENRYFFFESRAYGDYGAESVSQLARRWAAQVFGVSAATAFIAPRLTAPSFDRITVSFGVGENPAKRLPDPFEEEVLACLTGFGLPVVVDKGAGGEEAARVERAVRRISHPRLAVWEGAFAPFAARIAASRLYVGYDSAGQHVAAACGVPLVSVFSGFASERMFHRWRPTGPGPIEVIRADDAAVPDALERVSAAARSLL